MYGVVVAAVVVAFVVSQVDHGSLTSGSAGRRRDGRRRPPPASRRTVAPGSGAANEHPDDIDGFDGVDVAGGHDHDGCGHHHDGVGDDHDGDRSGTAGTRRSWCRGAGAGRTDPTHRADTGTGDHDHHDRATATAEHGAAEPAAASRTRTDATRHQPPATQPPATQPPAPPPASTSSDAIALTNQARANAGLAALSANGALNNAAAAHSADQAARNQMTHTGSNGSNAGDRIRAAGYSPSTWGENVAAGYSSASSVVAGWMASSGHRANILNPAFTQIGVASATAANGTRYWTMVLAG